MAQVNAGRVRFVSRGEYNNSTQYYLFDLVDYNGNSYFAKVNTKSNIPTNTTYWQLVAEKGNTGNVGPTGPTGNGIASIEKTATAGFIDTYTITYTNGSTSTFYITNGKDGDVTQEYVDEESERLRSLYNVLPKVSGSGESVELDNIGDTMLYKVGLSGNTSQEVVSGEVGLEVEDTSVYVDDVNEDKENYVTLKGNTYQETTSISGGDQYDSPSPDYPQEIEVVTGNNTIKVEGKNLFDKDNANQIKNWFVNQNKIVLNNNVTSFYIKCKPNTQYTLSKIASTRLQFWCTVEKPDVGVSTSNTLNQDYNFTGTVKTITTTSDANYLLCYYYLSTSDTLTEEEIRNTIQIEQGSQATSYEEYKGASYEVNLGSIELCKIGDYQDKIYKSLIDGEWYVHKEIGKVVLDGSESWFKAEQGYLLKSTDLTFTNRKLSTLGFCDKFIVQEGTSTWTGLYKCGWNAEGIFWIRDNYTLASSLEEWISWLSNNNVEVYYVLETPTETPITNETLASQLNALYNAKIHSTTHINTETSNLLPYIDLKYNVITASPSPDRASEVEVVKGNNTITISNEDGTKTQSYHVTLGDLELCKIGDYQDYIYYDKISNKWYKYKAIHKIILDGSENFEKSGSSTETIVVYYTTLANKTIEGYGISDKFIYSSSLENNKFDIVNYGENIRFKMSNEIYSTVQDFKNWLSNNNVEVYYVLDTPTSTKITDQLLISQLDELKNAMSYYDKTLITQENDSKPFILDVVGIRDLQDLFNL